MDPLSSLTPLAPGAKPAMRWAFAAGAAFIGLGAIITRDNPPVDWSLMAPTVAAFVLWAAFDRFPAGPMYLLGGTTPLVLNIIESDDEVSMFLVILTIAVVASLERNRTLVVWYLSTVLVATMIIGVTGAASEFSWQNWILGGMFSWFFGEIVYRYSQTIDELRRTRALVADQAALRERKRIAGDVHDLVGHSLSVMMLHVTGARHLIRRDPDEAERALDQAESAGRQSMAEIRRTIGLLRDEAAGGLPSPDLGDLETLVGEFALAGLHVTLDVAGPVDSVGTAVGVAGYRIVQEALTNVSRHTLGAAVTVTVRLVDDTCHLAVANTGGDTLEPSGGTGFGLVGMRERARSVGGSLIAGPAPDGWLVEATLPLTSTSDARQ